MRIFVTALLALVHRACGASAGDLDLAVPALAEEDACAAGAGDGGDCGLHLLQLRGEQQVAEQAMEVQGVSEGSDAPEATEETAEAEADDDDPVEESDEGPDVAVLSEMSASERAALLGGNEGGAERGGRIDMIWPGSAYAGVMDGGIWQAAKFDNGYTIDSILASSGGAASAFLCMVDEAHGTDRYLTTYKKVYKDFAKATVYGWSSMTPGCNTKPADDTSCWWYWNYKQVLDSRAFSNVRKKLKISMYCKKTGLTVLYNFKNKESVAQALAAAGNGAVNTALKTLYFKVDSLDDWCYDYDTSMKGYGFPSKFNPQKLPVYYYNNGPTTILTGAASSTCSDGWTSIAASGYKCVDYAIKLGRKHWKNKNYLWRPGSYSSISNNFYYSFGPATWVAR